VSQAFGWLFRSRETGRVVVMQVPNRWLVLYGVLRLGEAVLPTYGVVHWAATTALVWWAGLELVHGVNPFRRVLGAAVLVFVVI
jgi:hypothetical protein